MRRAVSEMLGGLLVVLVGIAAILASTAIAFNIFSGLYREQQITNYLHYKDAEYLSMTINGSNLIVTNGGQYATKITQILIIPPSGQPSFISFTNPIVLYSGASYNFSNLLHKPYRYAIITSYGNEWYVPFDINNPALDVYALTIASTPGGTTSPAPGTYYYTYGKEVTISASPNSYYTWGGWTGSGQYSYTGNSQTATLYMWSNMTETATFNPIYVTVTFYQNGLPSNAEGTILTVNGVNYNYNQLPVSFRWVVGSYQSFAWASPINTGSGVQYIWQSTTGLSSSQSGWVYVSGPGSITGNYATSNSGSTYTITFSANGLSLSASGTVLTVDGVNYGYSQLPATFSWQGGTSHTFSWASPISGGSGIQYVWQSTTGLSNAQSGTITVTGSGSITGNYATSNSGSTYTITFSANGLSSSASGTVLTVDGVSYNYNQLPISFSWQSGSQHSFSWASPINGGQGTQFIWQSTSGLSTAQSATITVTGSGSITGNYGTQYYLTMSASPSSDGSVSPASGWYNAGSKVTITATPNSGYNFAGWSGSGSGSYSGSNNPATITLNGPISETANFGSSSSNTYTITFSANGLSSSASGTVLTVDGNSYTYSQLPVSFSWAAGSQHFFAWSSPVSGGSGTRYVWQSTTGLSSSQSGSVTVTGSGS
ncbi:MAG: hypothetical protein QXG05_08930, partial [Nitrososphaerota archaeon]